MRTAAGADTVAKALHGRRTHTVMTSQLLRALALIAALFPIAQSPSAMPAPVTLPLTGTVSDAAGKPIAGVRVTSWPVEDTRTNASGQYTLAKPHALVRFSLAGYRPVTKPWTGLGTPVIMQPAFERPQAIADCPASVKMDKRQAGASLRMVLPRDAKIKTSANTEDYSLLAVGRHTDWMIIGVGARWSNGLPEWKLFKEFVTFEERDITVDDPLVSIADYSGMLRDGSHFRFIGLLGQSIAYTDATVESAAYFDRILETLCWSPR